MFRSRRLASAALLALVLGCLPGCPAFTGVMKTIGLDKPPRLELPAQMPPDFELVIHVVGQQDPAADYLLVYRRSGHCDYRMTVRAPKRRESSGSFELLEGQVQSLYDRIREMTYDEIQDRYPDSGVGTDTALGVQAYSVKADNMSREVQTHYQSVPSLEKLRTLALSMLPAKLMSDTGSGAPQPGKSREIIADLKTKFFYPADDPRLKDVPPERRQPFPSWEEALNFGYSPVPGYEPWVRKE